MGQDWRMLDPPSVCCELILSHELLYKENTDAHLTSD